MRTTRTEQPSVFQAPQIDHTVGADLELASLLLDQHPELLEMVGRCVGGSATRGRVGLTCETILRCAVIARLMNFSYRELEFALHDSKSTQRFARVDPLRVPKKSALQSAISMIDARTWEQLDRVLLREAKEPGGGGGQPPEHVSRTIELRQSTCWYNDWRQVALPAPEAFTPVLPVSVVVPYYAQPEELARTLAALEGQTYPRKLFEVVVVDDGSPEPLERPRSTPLDVKVVRQEDRGFGLARARNTGVRAAAHDIVVFLDGDMLPEAGWLTAHARWHHGVSDAVTLGLRAYVSVDGMDAEMIRNRPGTLKELFEGRRVNPSWVEYYLRRTNDLTSRADDLFCAVVGSNFGVRRTFYELVGGSDESFTQWGAEDVEFGYRAYTRGALLVPVRDAFAWHQGPWEEGRAEKKKSLELQRATCAHLIAHPRVPHRPGGPDLHGAAICGDAPRGRHAGGASAGGRRAPAGRPDARSGGAGGAGRGPPGSGVAGAPVGSGPAGAGCAGPLRFGGVPRVLVPHRAARREAAACGRGAKAARRAGDGGGRQFGVSRRLSRVDHAGVGAASGVARAERVGRLRLRRGGDDPGQEAVAETCTGGRGVASTVEASAGQMVADRRSVAAWAVRPVVRTNPPTATRKARVCS